MRDYFFLLEETPSPSKRQNFMNKKHSARNLECYENAEDRKVLAELKLGMPLSNAESILKTAEWVASCCEQNRRWRGAIYGPQIGNEQRLDMQGKFPVKESVDAIKPASPNISQSSSYFQPLIKRIKID